MTRFLRIGGLTISSYTAMLYVGCVAGTTAGAMMARAAGMDSTRFVIATIALLIPALVGARLWFVVQHLNLFRANPRRIWARGEGGAALYGGLVLAVALSPAVLGMTRLPFWPFWDASSVTMLLGLILTRFGCVMNGCCVGRETTGPLAMWLPDHRGEWRRRYPTQMLEAGWSAIILIAILMDRRRFITPGTMFATVVVAYAAGRLIIEPTRASANRARTIHYNLVVSAALVLLASAILLHAWWR